jgi:uncharacterized protein YndB with AHSA1/START domain
MPKFAHTVDVAAPGNQVFAILDDVDRTPEWLTRCTRIDRLDSGPNTVGTRLRYHYKSGGREGTMEGRVTAHEPDEHIAMLYTDAMMDVAVDFVARAGTSEATTTLTHTIDIRTKGAGMLFWPVIKATLPRQTTDAMDRLKRLAETEARP